MNISIREMKTDDVSLVLDYFYNATPAYLNGMGADKQKLPNRKEWEEKLYKELGVPIHEKKMYYIIWVLDGVAVGHSNINNIVFGKTASMHLHLWKNDRRQRGIGTSFLNQTLPLYFSNFELKKLICEPYALNPAPNKTLLKIGFKFIRNYMTTPGFINFYQSVNQYEITRNGFDEVFKTRY